MTISMDKILTAFWFLALELSVKFIYVFIKKVKSKGLGDNNMRKSRIRGATTVQHNSSFCNKELNLSSQREGTVP